MNSLIESLGKTWDAALNKMCELKATKTHDIEATMKLTEEVQIAKREALQW